MSVTSVRPVVERIAQAIYERLRLLTAQYSVFSPVPEVVRPTRLDACTPKNMQVILTQDAPQRNEELDCPGNPPAIAYDVLFNIRCHIMPSEKDPTPVEEYINVLAADVVRVVCDATDWHTFGGLAINANWQSQENTDADGSFDGVNVPLLVTYRTDETNPFTVRG